MKKILISLLFSLIFVGGTKGVLVNAEESDIDKSKVITLRTNDFISDEEMNNAISEYLNTGEFTTVNVIDSVLEESPMPRAGAIKTNTGESIQLNAVYNETGALLNSVSGPTGMKLNLTYSKSISRSVSGQIGISNSFITLGAGYSVTGSDTVSFSGTYTVPKEYKRTTVSGYTLYQVKRFDVYKLGPRWDRYIYAKRPIGISYSYKHQK